MALDPEVSLLGTVVSAHWSQDRRTGRDEKHRTLGRSRGNRWSSKMLGEAVSNPECQKLLEASFLPGSSFLKRPPAHRGWGGTLRRQGNPSNLGLEPESGDAVVSSGVGSLG